MISLRKLLAKWTAAPTVDLRDLLHSNERMKAIVERERMRADRGGSIFCLLTCTFPQRDVDLATLAPIFRDRIRVTDDVGVLGPRRIGVVLPETNVGGAWKLADDICELLPAHVERPKCEVFAYPSDQAPPSLETNRDAEIERTPRKSNSMGMLFAQPLPAWKRGLDIIGSSLALIVLSPLLLGVAIAIKLTSRGPVIFKQRRDTLGGSQFMIYKFRTMKVNAEAEKAALRAMSEQDGPAFKIVKDPRITSIGRFLRVTSIDELPQFLNVLKGEMTIVGPRAMDSKESRDCEAWQRRRLDVTAGLTCIWQVKGRSTVSFAEWMRMDLSYIKSRSLKSDLKLMFQTVPAVLLRRGAC